MKLYPTHTTQTLERETRDREKESTVSVIQFPFTDHVNLV